MFINHVPGHPPGPEFGQNHPTISPKVGRRKIYTTTEPFVFFQKIWTVRCSWYSPLKPASGTSETIPVGLPSALRDTTQLSLHIEQVLYRSMRCGRAPGHTMYATVTDIETLRQQPKQLDFGLLRHILSGVAATSGIRSISCATDKANVGNSLQNTLFATPSNLAIVATPQVLGIMITL